MSRVRGRGGISFVQVRVVQAHKHHMLGVVAGATSAFLLFAGGAAMKWYFWDVVIRQADEPDRSMLFWGLPIVVLGLGALGGGVAFAWLTYRAMAHHSDPRSG